MSSPVKNVFSETQLMLKTVNNNVMDLQIVEGFLSAVERKYLQFPACTFEVKKVKDALQELNEIQLQDSIQDYLEAEIELNELLQEWRLKLQERDLQIETQQIRRFCDEFKKPFEYRVFGALTRFYRSLPHSPSIQSKYDFVVTRYFLKETKNNYRQMRFERDEIVRHLIDLSEKWNIHSTHSTEVSEEVIFAVSKFDEFIFEAEYVTSFEELVSNKLFESLRAFKCEIGEFFYQPSVTASAIECNIAIGNIFAELLAQENEKLSRIISNQFDFASVLHDTAPNAGYNSTQILQNIRQEDLAENHTLDDDSTQIWEWLQLVCGNKEIEKEAVEPLESELPIKSSGALLPAKQRIQHLLGLIADQNSDKTPVIEFLHKSSALKTLELGIFLSPENSASLRKLFQDTLSTVLWAEEVRNIELLKKDKLSEESSNEIGLILVDLQTLSERLKAKIDEMESQVTHNLLYVSNQLLESRLKLERAIVRYSKQNLENSTVEEEPISPIPTESKSNESLITTSFEVNRWLFAVTVFCVIGSFVLYFFVNGMEADAKVTNDIEIIETQKLPHNVNFKTAQRVKDTLYITANEDWKTFDKEKQTLIMNELLHLPTKTPIISVTISDSEGNVVGNATAEQIETAADLNNPLDEK